MPGRKARKGNTEPSRRKPGVCNEQVPSTEVKVCSELHGNMQKAAEMTASGDVVRVRTLRHQVTACNTEYIYYRPHSSRNMVPLEPDRFSMNQDAMVKLIGWAGNMTISNSRLQGVLTA